MLYQYVLNNDAASLREALDERPAYMYTIVGFHEHYLLHTACKKGYVEVVRVLLDHGLDVHERHRVYGTPLALACRSGHAEVVSLLLAKANPHQERDIFRRTLLMVPATCDAAWSPRYEDVLRALLADERVEVDTQDLLGKTALWWACHKGLTDMARLLLLEGKADPTVAASGGVTPLTAAERGQHKDCVQLLEVQPRGGVRHHTPLRL